DEKILFVISSLRQARSSVRPQCPFLAPSFPRRRELGQLIQECLFASGMAAAGGRAGVVLCGCGPGEERVGAPQESFPLGVWFWASAAPEPINSAAAAKITNGVLSFKTGPGRDPLMWFGFGRRRPRAPLQPRKYGTGDRHWRYQHRRTSGDL